MNAQIQVLTPNTVTPLSSEVAFRTPPMNIEAEQILLGALLVKNGHLEKMSDFLKADHFFDPAHQKIYAAIVRITEKGQTASPITLKNYFENDKELETVGGVQYLVNLASSVISTVNPSDFAAIVHENYLKRQLVDIGEGMVNEAYDHKLDVTAQSQIEKAEKSLFDLATIGTAQSGFVKFDVSLLNALETAKLAFNRGTAITGYTTGLTDVDKMLGGMHPSDLVILAGRPAMGKTSLATNMAFNCAKAYLRSAGKEGGVVGFFSLEMSAEQLATRILAEETGISSDKIRRGDIKKTDFPKFAEASQELGQLPLYIDDTPALSVQALRTRARRLKRIHGLDFIVIDYLQLLRGSDSRNSENRVQEISEISRGLKALAKELHIPVIALSQLSRAVETREDKKPQLSDLRESGSIEQDADVVMFVYREQYYHERAEPKRKPDEDDSRFNERYERWRDHGQKVANLAEVIIAKQRHGPVGTVTLFFDGAITKFSDLQK
jgi:replicative DNA helicase